MARSTKAGLPGPAALPLWRLVAVSALALTTANCAQNPQKLAAPAGSSSSSYDPKYGVKASPRLYTEGQAIPKGGGRRFSGKPYVVAGRTYVPRDDAKGYVREGLASWYGSAFHGRMTANGEVFDRHSIAAAHPTLPLPSYARVTNLSNGHSMIVRVNDRGPYHANRVMDVSEEVAGALEFRRTGTARVRVEYVGKASTAGSDDRKLLATLRTDGEPAAVRGRAPVMMADLGPDAAPAPERMARPERPALAFRPEAEDEPEAGAVPAPRPPRPAPVLVAGAANVAVPAALQPTAARPHTFRPTPPSREEADPPVRMAQSRPARPDAPLSLSPPPMRLAGAAFAAQAPSRHAASLVPVAEAKARPGAVRMAAASAPAASPAKAAPSARMATFVPPGRPVAAMPVESRLAIARLATAKLGTPPAGSVAATGAQRGKATSRRAQLAEVE